jgi:hypothetical protein
MKMRAATCHNVALLCMQKPTQQQRAILLPNVFVNMLSGTSRDRCAQQMHAVMGLHAPTQQSAFHHMLSETLCAILV